MRAAIVACAVMLGFSAADRAHAQAAEAAEPPTARGLFVEGMAALDSGDTTTAETRFRESFALEERASTALNLALVLQERGALGEALALYDRLLGGELGEPPVAEDELRAFRARAERDQATLTITTAGADVLEILLDDEVVGAVRPGVELTLRVDPGVHTVAGRAGEPAIDPIEVEVARGQSERVSLERPSLAPRRVVTTAPAEEAPRDPVVVAEPEEAAEGGSALPWLLVGAGVLAVAAAVVITIIAVSASDGDRYAAGPFGNVTALTRP